VYRVNLLLFIREDVDGNVVLLLELGNVHHRHWKRGVCKIQLATGLIRSV
jgi:hypothetical protein